MLTLGLGGLESYFGHLQEITKLKEELAQIENYEEYNYGSSSFSKTGTQKLEDINEETVTTLRNDDINELNLKALGNEETITTVNLSELTEKSNFYSANEKEKLTEIEVSQDKNSSLPVLDILIDTEQTSKPERDYLPRVNCATYHVVGYRIFEKPEFKTAECNKRLAGQVNRPRLSKNEGEDKGRRIFPKP